MCRYVGGGTKTMNWWMPPPKGFPKIGANDLMVVPTGRSKVKQLTTRWLTLYWNPRSLNTSKITIWSVPLLEEQKRSPVNNFEGTSTGRWKAECKTNNIVNVTPGKRKTNDVMGYTKSHGRLVNITPWLQLLLEGHWKNPKLCKTRGIMDVTTGRQYAREDMNSTTECHYWNIQRFWKTYSQWRTVFNPCGLRIFFSCSSKIFPFVLLLGNYTPRGHNASFYTPHQSVHRFKEHKCIEWESWSNEALY